MTNIVIIAGHLTRDAELSYTAQGTAICKFGIAHNRNYKQGDEWKEEVSFLDVTVWGKIAERTSNFTKGRGVVVCGRLKQDRWQDKNNDSARSKICIIANEIYPIHKADVTVVESEDDIPS